MVILGVYALIAVVTPLLHHDIACHLQSKSHCDACTVSSTASNIETGVVYVGHFGAVEPSVLTVTLVRAWAERPSSPGRAPPQESSIV